LYRFSRDQLKPNDSDGTGDEGVAEQYNYINYIVLLLYNIAQQYN